MKYLDMVLDQYSRTDFYPFHMPDISVGFIQNI